jgi:UDP-N-acetylmuramoylalanine--D-glutamate ligase
MTPVTCMAGRHVALFGLGGSGLATALALAAGGARVTAWDDNEARVAEAGSRGIGTGDLRGLDWSTVDALLLSPGVPLTHPEPHWTVGLAKAAGVEVIGDVELFCRERRAIAPGAPFVAITGTNGKSTTTALTAHLFADAGRDTQMGGNIGTAILSLAPPAADRVHVVECSSYQIDLAPSLDPTVGVHLNLSPDHLDRHGTMEAYAAIKERLVAGAEIAVVGVDDGWSRAIAERVRAAVPVSVEGPLADGIAREGAAVVVMEGGRVVERFDLSGIGSLRGAHNAQNAAAAIAAARALGLDRAAIERGLRSFPGLAHRMEQVGRIGRVLFVNDSKATNADSTEKALSAFPRVHWILGGKAKAGGIEPLAPYFDRVARAYLIGEASDAFAATLEGRVAYERCGTLEVAVARAAEVAAADESPEPVVLLSPACASFDQFPNFEVRGNRFRDLVRALPGLAPVGG